LSRPDAVVAWSNTGVFVRVWDYDVPDESMAAFRVAYGAQGAWAELFRRAPGFLGIELYRDGNRGDRFLTIDRWRNEQNWRSFQAAFGSAYEALDARLDGLAVAERALFEGTSEL
jgi:heme-degrading monooxygenase HmoA